MTSRIRLPDGGSFVQITDGTNSAWVTGDCLCYIGTDAPATASAVQPLPQDGLIIYAPVVLWVKLRSELSPFVTVSTW